MYIDIHSRIQELNNNLEIENSRNKSHAKISEFTVLFIRQENISSGDKVQELLFEKANPAFCFNFFFRSAAQLHRLIDALDFFCVCA